MITLIILLIIFLTLVSSAGYVVINMMTHTSQMNKSIEEGVTISQWANLINQNSKTLGKDLTLIPPMGFADPSANYLTPPSWLPGKKVNNWDLPFVYCPYSLNSQSSGFNNSVAVSAESSYSIQTVSDTNGNDFVYASEVNPNLSGHDLLAIIISPIPSSTLPSCNDVIYDTATGTYNVTNYNGTVEVITSQNSISQRQSQSIILDSQDTELKLSSEVSSWVSTSPENYTINVPNKSSSYYNTDNVNFVSPTKTLNKQINILGESKALSVINSDILRTVTFENVVVNLKDITLGANIKPIFINSSVYLEDVKVTDAEFYGGKVVAKGVINFTNKNKEIIFKNTVVDFESANLNYESNALYEGMQIDNSNIIFSTVSVDNKKNDNISFLIEHGSDVIIKDSLTVSGNDIYSVLSVNSNSSLLFDSASLNINTVANTGIYTKGRVELNNSTIKLNAALSSGIIMSAGGSLVLSNSSIGDSLTAPTVSVRDLNGGMYVGGQSTQLYSTSACWLGVLFSTVDGTLNGNSSIPVQDTYKMGNRSQWVCNIN